MSPLAARRSRLAWSSLHFAKMFPPFNGRSQGNFSDVAILFDLIFLERIPKRKLNIDCSGYPGLHNQRADRRGPDQTS
jgi:hypothetical protein